MMGVSLYLLAPSLLATFSSFPELGQLSRGGWWRWSCSRRQPGRSTPSRSGARRGSCRHVQLTGNAAAKVPGGGANATYGGMLRGRGSYPRPSPVFWLNALTFAALLSPAAGPADHRGAGTGVAHDLQTTLWLTLVALLGLLALGAVLRPTTAAGGDRHLRREGAQSPAAQQAARILAQRLLAERARPGRPLVGSARRRPLAAGLSALGNALLALGSSPSAALLLLAFVAAQVLAFIPVTPGGLGFVEAGLAAMLVLAGVSAGDAVVATLAYRLVSYWLPMPVGLAAWALHKRQIARHGPVTALEPGTGEP
jgi:hypothetical protein